jgi:hypothetical protein
LRKHTNGSRDTKENSVVIGLGKTIVLEEDTGMLVNVRLGLVAGCDVWTYSINIGVWVLGLSVLSQDTRGNLVDLGNKLEHGVYERSVLCILAA